MSGKGGWYREEKTPWPAGRLSRFHTQSKRPERAFVPRVAGSISARPTIGKRRGERVRRTESKVPIARPYRARGGASPPRASLLVSARRGRPLEHRPTEASRGGRRG